ncbi:hypothetical protein BDN72DRAFT_209057 [Pluteus cervinus]|uniref:Uncharacterized protein n=1 Tax=Pluteus cervinus TaxID=181527 RepID=A0ACD3AHK9_9AGAR|nr:hypothetical protein BDN72DRAFT_209057 [Pluteus cervinus]
MSGENDDEMRHIIDAEVLQLRLRVSKLLSKRNALAPISRLPTELMTIIFIYARDFSKNKSMSTMALKLSWICRDWRHISLNASRLWAEIDFKFGRQAGVQEFLSRSRQALLSVALSCDSEVTDTILDSTHRICGFDLSFDAFEPHRSNHLNLHHIWMKDAPFLRSLTLHGTYLPEIPLAHLQHLQLRNCAFQWSSPQLCALTTLSIVDPATTTALVDLLSNLAGLPELTHLTLEAVLSGPPLPSGFPQANLPKLQDFRITNEGLPTLTTLIDHLSVSKGALSSSKFLMQMVGITLQTSLMLSAGVDLARVQRRP